MGKDNAIIWIVVILALIFAVSKINPTGIQAVVKEEGKVTFTEGDGILKDARWREFSPSQNLGQETTCRVRANSQDDSFCIFAIDQILADLPEGAVLTKADLHLIEAGESKEVTVKAWSSDNTQWDETTTSWNSAFCNLTEEGKIDENNRGECREKLGQATTKGEQGNKVVINILGAADDPEASQYTIILQSIDSGEDEAIFYTREASPENRPQVIYEYQIDPNVVSCSGDTNLVCGTDAKTYDNACEANKQGIQVNYTGQCEEDETSQEEEQEQEEQEETANGEPVIECSEEELMEGDTCKKITQPDGDECSEGNLVDGQCEEEVTVVDIIQQPQAGGLAGSTKIMVVVLLIALVIFALAKDKNK